MVRRQWKSVWEDVIIVMDSNPGDVVLEQKRGGISVIDVNVVSKI